MSHSEITPHGSSKAMADCIGDLGEIVAAVVSCDGRNVAITAANSALAVDPKLYLWQTVDDVVTYFNFVTGEKGGLFQLCYRQGVYCLRLQGGLNSNLTSWSSAMRVGAASKKLIKDAPFHIHRSKHPWFTPVKEVKC